MGSRYAADLAEIKERLVEHGEALTSLVAAYGCVQADMAEIKQWLIEAGLNSTGEGRRRLNELLQEESADEERRRRRQIALDWLFGWAVRGVRRAPWRAAAMAIGTLSALFWSLQGAIALWRLLPH